MVRQTIERLKGLLLAEGLAVKEKKNGAVWIIPKTEPMGAKTRKQRK